MKTIGEDVLTTPAERWQIAGRSVPKVNAREVVTGRHHYSSDIQRDGMLHGKVLRPSAFSSSLISLDIRKAETMKGVTVVREDDFIGLVAPNEHLADRAIEAIEAQWRPQGDLMGIPWRPHRPHGNPMEGPSGSHGNPMGDTC